MQFLGEFGIANEQRMVDAATWLERGLELARREGFAAAEAIGVYTLGVVRWVLGDLAAAEELLEQSLASLRALAELGPRSGFRRRSTSPRCGRATPPAGPGCGSSSRRRCSRSPRSRATRPSATCSRISPAIARARGDFAARPRAARRGGRAVRAGRATSAARPTSSSGAGTSSSPRALFPEARACLERALELRRQLNDRRGVGLALAGLGLIDTTAGDYEKRRAASRRGARHLPARRRPLGAREHALAHRRPRPRARPARRGGGGARGGARRARRDAARALDRPHARRARRGGGAPGRRRAGCGAVRRRARPLRRDGRRGGRRVRRGAPRRAC